MRPIRTAKSAANRVDETYVQKPRRGFLLLLTVVALVAAGGWWAMHLKQGNAAIYSPGKVASVHLAWDTNCAACHDGDGHGGFTRTVSDSACLKCHKDAATVHSPHQKTMVQSFSDEKGKQVTLSAKCAECHVEHRGHDALLAKNDSTCLQCHRDVTNSTNRSLGPLGIQAKVTAFSIGAHPKFGRDLIPKPTTGPSPSPTGAPADPRQDPTPLYFGHLTHGVDKIKPLEGQTENCTVCHEPPAPAGDGVGVQPNQRYMKPVSYEKHCASCHPLEAVAGTETPMPHIGVESLRPLLTTYADREGHYWAILKAMTPDQQKKTLVSTKPPAVPGRAPVVTTITAEQWVAKQAQPFWDPVKKWYTDENNQAPGIDETKTALEGQADFPAALRNAKTLEFYVLHNKTDKCAFCHKLTDDTAAVEWLRVNAGAPLPRELADSYHKGLLPAAAPTKSDPAPTPATLPSSAPAQTLPTGITSAPRRWYVNSVFDHSAHRFTYDSKTNKQREMSCLECHAAKNSDLMTDVLVPGIESCVTCHHAPSESGPSAVDSCLACHPFYHDRSAEQIPRTASLAVQAEQARRNGAHGLP